MDTLERGRKTIQEAEAALRELVSEAATAGDYTSVVQIAGWARATSEILKGIRSSRAETSAPQQQLEVGKKAIAPVSRSARTTLVVLSDQYPRFFREGNRLVRVAWSKREKKEYEHKAPSSVLKALSTAMIQQGEDGKIFTTDKILPVYDEDESLIPSYQAYVGIALLKKAGLIDQHGRQGYSIPRPAELSNAAEAVWHGLPTK